MWTIFKLTNLFYVLVSSYIWFTAQLPLAPLLMILNVLMLVFLSFLQIDIKLDSRTGFVLLAFFGLVVWNTYIGGMGLGFVTFAMYLPALILIQLPREYQVDLLEYVTKWFAILLIPALLIYWVTLVIPLPDFGLYNRPPYKPFMNYIFYLKTTFDYGRFVRFNAFFLEPGHLAMPCEFLLIANRFDFKKCPWLWIIIVAIGFSFSLAGYLITFTAFVLMKGNTIAKGIGVAALVAALIVGLQSLSGGKNAVNELIIERLEYDESKGIKGNNRYFDNTDFEFDKSLKNGDFWAGVRTKANMDLIGGSGFKIYILQYGLIGVLLVLAFYISLIPPNPNWKFTLTFFFLIALCFMQNAYPGWYSWLLPYILGLDIYSRKGLSDEQHQTSQPLPTPEADNEI